MNLKVTQKDIIQLPDGRKAIILPNNYMRPEHGRKPLKEHLPSKETIITKTKEINKKAKKNISKLFHTLGNKLDPGVK